MSGAGYGSGKGDGFGGSFGGCFSGNDGDGLCYSYRGCGDSWSTAAYRGRGNGSWRYRAWTG